MENQYPKVLNITLHSSLLQLHLVHIKHSIPLPLLFPQIFSYSQRDSSSRVAGVLPYAQPRLEPWQQGVLPQESLELCCLSLFVFSLSIWMKKSSWKQWIYTCTRPQYLKMKIILLWGMSKNRTQTEMMKISLQKPKQWLYNYNYFHIATWQFHITCLSVLETDSYMFLWVLLFMAANELHLYQLWNLCPCCLQTVLTK